MSAVFSRYNWDPVDTLTLICDIVLSYQRNSGNWSGDCNRYPVRGSK